MSENFLETQFRKKSIMIVVSFDLFLNWFLKMLKIDPKEIFPNLL